MLAQKILEERAVVSISMICPEHQTATAIISRAKGAAPLLSLRCHARFASASVVAAESKSRIS